MSESKKSFQFPMQQGSLCTKTKVIQANFTMGGSKEICKCNFDISFKKLICKKKNIQVRPFALIRIINV